MTPTPDTDTERQITALLAEIPEEIGRTFTRYYQGRLARALETAPADALLGATDPYACEADLIARLLREADGRESASGLGEVPGELQVLSIPIPQSDPRTQAAVRAGAAGSAQTPREAQRQRRIWMVCAVLCLYPLWQFGLAVFGGSGGAAHTTPTPAVVTPVVTLVAAPRPAPVRADVPPASDTAYWYPTSLELPTDPPTVLRVVAAPGRLGGTWQPPLEAGTAAWLEGTYVNTVLCLPPALQPRLTTLAAGQTLTLRTANGSVRRYLVSTVRTVQRQQIEILTQRQARLTVLACGTDGADRAVAQARFLTDAGDDPSPAPTATLVPRGDDRSPTPITRSGDGSPPPLTPASAKKGTNP